MAEIDEATKLIKDLQREAEQGNIKYERLCIQNHVDYAGRDGKITEEDISQTDVYFFTCPLCNNVVNSPKECSKCQSLFCSSCLDKWTAKQPNICPSLCKNPTYGNLHRIVNKILNDQ